ncbi:MAG: hypothetical protein AAGL89_03300 [Pseudomonadota bacterium]
MKTGTIVALGVVVAVVAVGATYMIDIDQTQEAQLPDVNVTVEGGQMPEFDADVGSIEIGTEETTVSVPEIEVTMEETTVDVPFIDINAPEEDELASN